MKKIFQILLSGQSIGLEKHFSSFLQFLKVSCEFWGVVGNVGSSITVLHDVYQNLPLTQPAD